MMRPLETPEVVTFDCYGTLVQWDKVLVPAIERILARAGRADVAGSAVLHDFHGISLAAQQQPYRSYRAILAIGFAQAFEAHGVSLEHDAVDQLAAALAAAAPHPEVGAALRKLQARCRIGIITNSDDALIAPVLARLGVQPDFVVTAEQARAYKPDPAIFALAQRAAGVPRGRIVHAAMSMQLDIAACAALGMRCVWINRRRLRGPQPWPSQAVLPDLTALPALLGC